MNSIQENAALNPQAVSASNGLPIAPNQIVTPSKKIIPCVKPSLMVKILLTLRNKIMNKKEIRSKHITTPNVTAKITGVRCDSCEQDWMQWEGAHSTSGGIVNLYKCPVCKKTKTLA